MMDNPRRSQQHLRSPWEEAVGSAYSACRACLKKRSERSSVTLPAGLSLAQLNLLPKPHLGGEDKLGARRAATYSLSYGRKSAPEYARTVDCMVPIWTHKVNGGNELRIVAWFCILDVCNLWNQYTSEDTISRVSGIDDLSTALVGLSPQGQLFDHDRRQYFLVGKST